MNIETLVVKKSPLKEWEETLLTPSQQLITGLTPSSKVLAIASSYHKYGGKTVVVLPSYRQVEKLSTALENVVGKEAVYSFFMDDHPQAEMTFSSVEKYQSRLTALSFLENNDASGILLVAASSFFLPLRSLKEFKESRLPLKIGETLSLETMIKTLRLLGYEEVGHVLQAGTFARRGDIVDIRTVSDAAAYRIEFFGDEINGIRLFDPTTQRSLRQEDRIIIGPAHPLFLTENLRKKALSYLKNSVSQSPNSNMEELIKALDEGVWQSDLALVTAFLGKDKTSLWEYIPENAHLIIDDKQAILKETGHFYEKMTEIEVQNLEQSKLGFNLPYFLSSPFKIPTFPRVTYLSFLRRDIGTIKFDAIYNCNQQPMQDFFQQITALAKEIDNLEKQGYTILVQTGTPEMRQRLYQELDSLKCSLTLVEEDAIIPKKAQLVIGHLPSGFQDTTSKVALITEQEIFRKTSHPKRRRVQIDNSKKIRHYQDLEIGDYVVHKIHGIGRYLGIETLLIDGNHRDYVRIQYQKKDQIALPVDHIHLLFKYLASDGKKPTLNRLNDGRFKQIHQKVKKDVEAVAEDLIALYAKRSQEKGFAFSADDSIQQDFEEAFYYVETTDQLRSIAEIKTDMQKPYPMDRLLVGDVGFGKTEVAMRAALKAVNDGKQIAVLVPTTVLAQQHLETFNKRFEGFAVTIDSLSRFKSKTEQKETLGRLAKGKVDIVIGTHRLLSKDVVFKDLGLLIIDEEQRFGVKDKERLKEIRTGVDVLTLTATPIPRTLHMSMLGIRDLSVIETPPLDRYPVQTYVLEMNGEIIRQAILREIERKGQVYYLYNKVDTIINKVAILEALVPEARIAYIHGRMTEIQLEDTLYAFMQGEYDVLVTTTIIETGVDIPAVNTLFVEDADNLGLSTLYQLRGRIGRTNRLAYAYLMYQPEKVLTDQSQKRLEAIKSLTTLGAGFRLAMQDLNIRGAGNLLGEAQSGFIDAVGYDLYTQLLEEAIHKKKGDASEIRTDTEITVVLDAYIPDNYISHQGQKIKAYQAIRQLVTDEDLSDYQDELLDIYGEFPENVYHLLLLSALKNRLDILCAKSLSDQKGQIQLVFDRLSQDFLRPEDYAKALSGITLKGRLTEIAGQIAVLFHAKGFSQTDLLMGLLAFTKSLLVAKHINKQ